MVNLIDNKIAYNAESSSISNNYRHTSVDDSNINNIPAISYIETEDTLIVKFHTNDINSVAVPEGATYHFATKSWTSIARSFTGSTLVVNSNTGDISNMITSVNGDMLYYQYKSGSYSRIMKWNHSSPSHSTTNTGGSDAYNYYYFTTKDFTFGNIAVRKKIYKVYVTYKSNESDTNVEIKAAVNGTGSFAVLFDANSKFKDGTACYTGSSLQGTSNVWKTAELKFASPSEVNKVYSLQIQFLSTILAESDFQINDISISHKVKNVK